jgi:hypothetical protein
MRRIAESNRWRHPLTQSNAKHIYSYVLQLEIRLIAINV